MLMIARIENLLGTCSRHFEVLGYMLRVVLPILLRTGRRPVLFSKYSGIGDIICTFPAVLELKKKHPGVVCIYNCHPQYACLPVMGGITNQVTNLPHIGVLGHWYGSLFAGIYQFPCKDELPNDFCREYVVLEYAADHDVQVCAAHPLLEINAAVQRRVESTINELRVNDGPVVVIQTGPTWPIREWPRENWVSLVTELTRRGCATIIQIGTEHHLSVGTIKFAPLPGVKSLVNQLTLEESAAVIATSSLFIGIDSGLLHLAAALRTPCVGIFGPTSPQLRLSPENAAECVVSRIDCQGCHHRVPRIHWESGCPHSAECMRRITTEEVLAACMKKLNF